MESFKRSKRKLTAELFLSGFFLNKTFCFFKESLKMSMLRKWLKTDLKRKNNTRFPQMRRKLGLVSLY